MSIQSQISTEKKDFAYNPASKRKDVRYPFRQQVDWDFFTCASGAKTGFIEDLSESGCLLRTRDPIEHRRWVRLIVRGHESNVYFTSVGRIIRREDRMESWNDTTFTLHRYGIEFIQPLNRVVIDQIKEHAVACAECSGLGATIPDTEDPHRHYCMLCHLRRSCQSLLLQDSQ